MAKAVEIDGKLHRMRRGKLVEIPAEWVGKIPTEKTIRQRPSKLIGKVKREVKRSTKGGLKHVDGRHDMVDSEA